MIVGQAALSRRRHRQGQARVEQPALRGFNLEICFAVTNVSGHQKDVDSLFARAKAEAFATERPATPPAPASAPPPPRLEPSDDPVDRHVAEELDTMRRRLEQLGNVLSNEPLLLHRYASQLQSIDLMMQQLGHLAAVAGAQDKAAAADRVTLQDLRRRLTRKGL